MLQQVSYYFTNIFINLDKGFLELVGPTGFSRVYRYYTRYLRAYYKQGITFHLLNIYVGVIVYFYIIEI